MTIPKIELHVHLEGTASPEMVIKLAHRNKITLPKNLINPIENTFIWHDFNSFLNAYDAAASVIKHPNDYYDITYNYLSHCAQSNTLYVEMMYSPEHAERATNIPSMVHLQAIQSAINDAKAHYGIVGRIIMTAVRHYGQESVMRVANHTIEAAATFSCIVGFGLGGNEVTHPGPLFKKAYDLIKHTPLGCTVHAGEFCGAREMYQTIESLPITRLGHGVRCIESKALMEKIKSEGIHLELCPSSNISTGVYRTLEEHPLKQLFDFGLSLSINSDDPPYFNTSIANEYKLAQKQWHLTDKDLLNVSKQAINASFAPTALKLELLRALTRV